jgi:tRNA(fMet)-specific endonuclease VapC
MSGNCAVDSNACIALCRGDAGVASMLGSADTVYLPAVVLGELLYGAAATGRPEANCALMLEFASKCELLEVNAEVAERYSELKLELRQAGKPIPDNDLWIAALCLTAGVPLVSWDRHFAELSALQVLSWEEPVRNGTVSTP